MRFLLSTLLLLNLGSVLVGCSSGDSNPVQTGIDNQVLHRGNADEISALDPHITTGMPEYRIQMAIFEGLVSKSGKTLEPVPGVAERWEVSEDATRFTFYLRDNAKWSDGTALTAKDFVQSWRRALLPALGNQYAYSMYVIKNAEAFHKGEISDFSQVGVQALDETTLQVDLNSPTPYFLTLLDHHSMFPVPVHIIEKLGELDDRTSNWTKPEHFVGNGPFVVTEWVPNKILTVEKNNNYWDADKVKLNAVKYYPIQQLTTEERTFRAGQLHLTNDLPIEKIQTYKEENPEVLRSFPYFGTYYYRFNTSKKPLDDVRVRQALTYAIDRELLVERVTKGGQLPAYSLTPPNAQGYMARAKVKQDVELARTLLADAGYPNGEGFPRLEILYNTYEDHKVIAVALQQMWKKALNIDVILQNQDWKVYLASVRGMDYQIARAGWIGDYLDPNTFLDMFVTDGGNNNTGWSNPRYDELIQMAANTASQEQRYEYFQQAEAILMDEVPIMPIYIYTRNYLVHPSVKNLHDNILDYHPYKDIYLERNEK